jgi:predicted Zn finger-like uncharacterized protein
MPVEWKQKISGMWGPMRLICPNCDAQYEVDDSAIPAEGRDVQCSNCGHTWFHAQGDPVDPPAGEPEVGFEEPEYETPAYQEQAQHGPVPPQGDGANADAAARVSPTGDDFEEEEDATVLPQAVAALAATAAPQRRGLDANVAALLREEAEREQQARRAESGGLESQADLGLEAALAKGRTGRADRAAKDPFADDNDTQTPQITRTGRAALPDIDQINATLNASDDHADHMRAESPAPDTSDPRRGFRLGFGIALLAGVAVWAVYVFTPQIVAQVPAAETALTALGGGIDAVRIWLDQIMRQVIASINGSA